MVKSLPAIGMTAAQRCIEDIYRRHFDTVYRVCFSYMKNDKIIHAFDTINPSVGAKNRVFDQATQRRQKRRPMLKAAVSLAAAATICLTVFGGTLLSSQDDNVFVLRAYAVEVQADGSVGLSEVSFLDPAQLWHTHVDGVDFRFYLHIRFGCEGSNIRRVDFYADDGFFAVQHLPFELGDFDLESVLAEDVPVGIGTSWGELGWNGDLSAATHYLFKYGDAFDVIGNQLTLDKGAMSNNQLYFVGTNLDPANWRSPPPYMTIRAVATFKDGTTQEEILTIDLSPGNGLTSGTMRYPDEYYK